MNKPISYPLAKLLKEKEYYKECNLVYYGDFEDGFEPEIIEPSNRSIRHSDIGEFDYLAPTIADVVMWLYEKHGIWLYCEIKGDTFYVKAKKIKSKWRRVVSGVVNNENILFNSPTEAYEAGIEHTLTKLI